MTERLFWTPESADDDPVITVMTDGSELDLKRTNSALYTYMGN